MSSCASKVRSETTPQELRLLVPTYNATYFTKQVEQRSIPEFGPPHVALLVREAEGVRLVLGTHDYDDCCAPDIQVERQPNGWVVFLHTVASGDPCGTIYFLDDGRSFLLKERDVGATPAITVLEAGSRVPGIDDPTGEA